VNTAFLSFHFDGPHEKIANQVTSLVTSHNMRSVTGEHLAGGGVSDTVKKRIEKSDALIAIALADPGRPLANGKFDTYKWVNDEIGWARGKGKSVAVFVPNDVDFDAGMHADAERIAYDSAAPLGAFLKLSQTIGIWKSEAGRTVRLLLIGEDLAATLGGDLENGTCHYRIQGRGLEEPGDWIEARLRGEVGGIALYAQGLKDEDLVEVKVKVGAARWNSRGEPQSIKVEMKKVPG
jgi:hypothetical protein